MRWITIKNLKSQISDFKFQISNFKFFLDSALGFKGRGDLEVGMNFNYRI